jgi:hypothetical protein
MLPLLRSGSDVSGKKEASLLARLFSRVVSGVRLLAPAAAGVSR